jgi:hypothetical protein
VRHSERCAPALAYLFSINSFADISGASNNGLSQIRNWRCFMAVGVYALINGTIRLGAFETVYHASQNFSTLVVQGLVTRRDPAYFDVNDIGGVIAAQKLLNSTKFRKRLGTQV